jgi:hypothetical protein
MFNDSECIDALREERCFTIIRECIDALREEGCLTIIRECINALREGRKIFNDY